MAETYSPEIEESEAAFLAYLEAQETPAALDGFQFVPGRQYADRPVPSVVVNGADSKERENGSRGVFDVDLEIVVISEAESDPEAAAHVLACGAVVQLLNVKAPVIAAINAGASGFTLFDYFLKGSPRRINQGGEWETFIVLKVIGRPG